MRKVEITAGARATGNNYIRGVMGRESLLLVEWRKRIRPEDGTLTLGAVERWVSSRILPNHGPWGSYFGDRRMDNSRFMLDRCPTVIAGNEVCAFKRTRMALPGD